MTTTELVDKIIEDFKNNNNKSRTNAEYAKLFKVKVSEVDAAIEEFRKRRR